MTFALRSGGIVESSIMCTLLYNIMYWNIYIRSIVQYLSNIQYFILILDIFINTFSMLIIIIIIKNNNKIPLILLMILLINYKY